MTKSGRGAPPGPRAGRQPSSGGCRPGLPLDSRPNPGLHWPPGRIGAPCAAGPGRGASAQPATGRGRFWADPAPLVRVWEMGPKRQPGTAAKPVAGQAAGPLGKLGTSQNYPQLYQGESGGLEPAMKPMAGQAGAPLHSLSPLRGPGASPVNLWPLSFDQESGDPGVGLLPDIFSNHRITHGTIQKEFRR